MLYIVVVFATCAVCLALFSVGSGAAGLIAGVRSVSGSAHLLRCAVSGIMALMLGALGATGIAAIRYFLAMRP